MINFRRGDRVRIVLNSSYRHFLDGLEGEITAVYHHAIVVALDNPPNALQKVIAPPTPSPVGRSSVGPKVPSPWQHVFQFHEVEKLNDS